MTKHNRKRKIKGKKLTAAQLKNEILKLFKRQPKKRLNAKQIIKKLKIANSKDAVQDALQKMADQNILFPIADHKYRLDRTTTAKMQGQVKQYEGTVDMTRSGAAYIRCRDLEDDVYVAAKSLKNALHGDRVLIAVYQLRGRRRPEGEVVRILERATEHFMGTLRLGRKYGIVIPDKLNMQSEIFVGLDDLLDASEGEKVVVKVVKWPTRHNHNPIGIITSVLGEAGGNDMEMKSILINNGFELEFPPEVLEESERLNDELSEEQIAARRDMREVTTFTIDPATAKDFDDALSLRYLEDGECEVGVHIADVTHYVHPATALDQEAFKRSTSVYLVDRVLPMLPEKLSNELCSLRPNEDKCTFSAIFTFGKNGKVKDRWFGKTLIHSNRRFTYEEAQEVLETGEGDFAKELTKLNQLAYKLRKQKFSKGAIAFEAEEVRFRLDEDGVPIDVYTKERKDAHMLIEDFMLLANREVATYINKKANGQEIPFVYRVHDEPNPDKIADFARFALQLGFKMELQTPKQIADSFNQLAQAAKKDSALHVLEPLAIRTMAKAEYTTDNIGHYGLGFQYYSHFTSPIRRYSDVLAHRILQKNLGGTFRTPKEQLEEKCRHISRQERKAMDAERESVKYKQVEFISKHVGESFDGQISGIIERGFFVELAHSKCEGMVGFETMEEPFELSDSRLSAQGKRSKRILKIGDPVRVTILEADLSKRRIEMQLEAAE
ncbi:MAG: ribonuclease R [Bacteroidota bacterium]